VVLDELIRKTLLVRVVLSPILPFVVAMYRVLIRKTLLVRVVLSPILPFVVAMYRVGLCLR
jgi:uncharacterized membrane protein YqaE (UPF0057 family)